MKPNGTIDKYKARLVVKGYRQKEGLDYFDTYSPVTRITSIRILMELAAVHDLNPPNVFKDNLLKWRVGGRNLQ